MENNLNTKTSMHRVKSMVKYHLNESQNWRAKITFVKILIVDHGFEDVSFLFDQWVNLTAIFKTLSSDIIT